MNLIKSKILYYAIGEKKDTLIAFENERIRYREFTNPKKILLAKVVMR